MIPYATPEWVEAMAGVYRANPENETKTFKGMSLFLVFRIFPDPEFGLEKDIYFGTHLVDGALQDDSAIISKEHAQEKADFILGASPQNWKRVIKKQQGFVSAFMSGKIKLDKGSAPKVISLAPKAPAVVDCFYQVDTEWPDEMSPERLEEYRALVREFTTRLGV
ncbi:MAG: SCP2 sterol-binding domain-containing protein [Chloroflexota bacterium]|nr:SCP2 sterol-binding domain-containing protein [Chloroflexota bacterium]